MTTKQRLSCLLAGLGIFFFPLNAHAYLDPGTGSMIIQLILSGIAGALMVTKIYWRRIREFFSRGGGEKEG